MSMTDPIADMLTRIRNANQLKYSTVSMPSSKVKCTIAALLLNEGYIANYTVETIYKEKASKDDPTVVEKEETVKKVLTLTLKYGPEGERVINNLKRISKPGLRVNVGANELPKVLNGLGIAIISTSQGIMTDKAARAKNIGGEVLAYVW